MLGGRYYWRTPLTSPKKILDVGCGTGIVTTALALAFPDAEVYGIDLSPVPARHGRPPNVTYILGDFNKMVASDDGPFGAGSFDFVFSRCVILGVKNWSQYVRRCVDLLANGGWLELQDASFSQVDRNLCPLTFQPDYVSALHQAAARKGMDWDAGVHLENYLMGEDRLNFDTYHTERRLWACSTWPLHLPHGQDKYDAFVALTLRRWPTDYPAIIRRALLEQLGEEEVARLSQMVRDDIASKDGIVTIYGVALAQRMDGWMELLS